MWNYFLEKDAGKPKIHRLRIIHIIEADWTALNKIFLAKQVMMNSEEDGAVQDEQNRGRRRGCSAIDVAVQKLAQYGVLTLSRVDNVTIDE